MSKMRNSNLEMLRIISMILIIAHHYTFHGLEIENLIGFSQYFAGWMQVGGKLGVACFVLITGYFMSESQISIKKVGRLATKVWLYSVSIEFIFLALQKEEALGVKQIVGSFFPIGTREYWFITEYMILIMASPILNAAIQTMTKSTTQKLIFAFLLFWSFCPNFFMLKYGVSSQISIFVLYFIAAYVRKYVDLTAQNPKKHLIGVLILGFALYGSSSIMILLGNTFNIPALINKSFHFGNIDSPIITFLALEIFILFSTSKQVYSKWVNQIAKSTLGVYLIHDNYLVRTYL